MTVAQEIEEVIRGGLAKLGPGFRIEQARFLALANRSVCTMCRHRKDEAFIQPGQGAFNPSPAWLIHFSDTHGQPVEIFASWLFFFPYTNGGETALHKLWGGLMDE